MWPWRAIRGELTLAQLAAKHGARQTLINASKMHAIEVISGAFSGKAEAPAQDRQGEIDKLHAMIG
jgi:transposase